MKIQYKLLILAGLVAAGMALSQWGPAAHFFGGPALRQFLEACRVSGWGPIAFMLLFAAGGMLALPAVGFFLLGGAVFGFWPGTLYSYVGCNLSALTAFGLARWLGRDAVCRYIGGQRLMKLESVLRRHGFAVLVSARILPLFPFNFVNFGSGILGIRSGEYFWGTLVGTLPATLFFTYYASVPGNGRNVWIEAAVVLLSITAIAAAAWTLKRTAESDAVEASARPEQKAVELL